MPPKVILRNLADEEEMKMTKKLMNEQELKKLTREEKLLRNFGLDQSGPSKKRRKVIGALTKEKDYLEKELAVMQTRRICLEDKAQAKGIADLSLQAENIDKEIMKEKEYIADLEEQIRKQSTIENQKRRKGKKDVNMSDFLRDEESLRANSSKESWKSRLHGEQVQLSTVTSDNASLRKKIQELLKAKAHFNQLFEDLIEKLHKGKKILADLVNQTNGLFRDKDELTRKLQALKDRDVEDLLKKQEEMQDLEMRLTEDKDLIDFKHKVMKLRSKLNESQKPDKKENQRCPSEEQKLQDLQELWDLVRRETGLNPGPEVCDLVTKQEADNFSMFNYNKELRYQLEVLTGRTLEMLKTVEDEEAAAMEWNDRQEAAKNQLQHDHGTVQGQAEDSREHVDMSRRLLDHLFSRVKALFDLARCDPRPLEGLLGANQTVTWFNYGLYLGLLETELVSALGLLPPEEVPTRRTSTILSRMPEDKTVSIADDRKLITRHCPECEELDSRGLRLI